VPGIAGATSGFVIRADKVVAGVGMPSSEHLDYAAAIVAGIPAVLTGGARDPFGASAVIYGLLFSRDTAVSDEQLRYMEQKAGSALHREVTKILPAVATLPAEHRLPLAELAVSSLKALSERQYRDFCGITLHLIEADKQVDLFEYALQRMIMRRLEPVFHKVKPPSVQYYDIGALLPQCAKLLSCLAYWGAADSAAAEKAFVKGAEKLGVGVSLKIAPNQACGLQALDESLDGLGGASPAIKKRVIEACVTCIGVDGRVTVEEAELLRVVGDALDCPIPPFLPGQKL
jgi:hypothetical protein